MTPVPRQPKPLFAFDRVAPWAGGLAVLGLVLFLIVRSCGYQMGPVMRYTAYYLFYVLLPGVVALHAIRRGSISFTAAVALGIPTGYAIEIFSFLALAAMGARHLLPFLPLVWLAAAALLAWRRREWPVRCNWTARHAAIGLSLALLFLCTAVSTATQMFAESPLVAGLPHRAIFHDWVYLVSRAAAIKHHWPFEDPSLAGTPLQYHYFMLVHAASASSVTGLEVMQVMLRFVMVPLGAVLVMQAYALGRLVSRSAWGGVLAALMTVALSELSFSPHYGEPVFLGLFLRWLYVSPTFYFGMVFFGALLLGVAEASGRTRLDLWHLVWLAGLAAAGTGAKGTMTPVVLVALGLWAAWSWWRDRRFPARLVLIGCTLSAGFLGIYLAIMSSWGTGQASFEPFRILQLTGFWRANLADLQRVFEQWMPGTLAAKVALVVCGLVVFAGTAGVRLLALAECARARRGVEPWLAATFLAAAAMGLFIHLHAYGELYLFLLVRLPMAVLAAAFIVGSLRVLKAELQTVGRELGPNHPPLPRRFLTRRIPHMGLAALAALGVGLTLAVQGGVWIARQHAGLREWLRQSPHMRLDDKMATLCDAMLWVRRETEPEAILVANAFTPKHLQQGRGELVDYTTAGVHFYYSALSERRLFVEGPTYLHGDPRVARRLQRAAAIFFDERVPLTSLPGGAPGYAIIDRSLNDGARIALPEQHRVYANARFEIYRLPRRVTVPPAGETITSLFDD